jgi:lysophospholipase L1-like esterase
MNRLLSHSELDSGSRAGTRPRPSGKAKRLVFNLVLAFVAALTPCLAAEVILRLSAPPADTPDLFTKTTAEFEWSGRPSAHGLFAGVPVSFNRFGFRDRERSLERTPGTIRILALGDSVTFGMGVAEKDSFPRVTEALLNGSRRDGLAPLEILNFGVPGYNTVHELAQLREVGLKFHPDMVVVGFLYNDVEPSTVQSIRLGRAVQFGGAHGASGSPLIVQAVKSDINASVAFLKHHSMFFAWLSPRLGVALRPLGAKGFGQVGEIKDQYVDGNPDWRWTRTALLDMKRLCENQGIPLVIVIIPAMAKFTESGYPIKEYHEAVSGFCRAQAINCLDLLPAFWGLDGTKFWVSLTDGHPNARAHRLMAEAVTKFLAPQLRERSAVMTRPASR